MLVPESTIEEKIQRFVARGGDLEGRVFPTGEGPLLDVEAELRAEIRALAEGGGSFFTALALAHELSRRHLATREALARATNTDVEHPEIVSFGPSSDYYRAYMQHRAS